MELQLDDLPHIVWVSPGDGTTLYLNRYGQEFLGLSANEAGLEAWLRRVHPDDAPRLQGAWKNASHPTRRYEIEYRLQAADGRYHWVLERGFPRHGQDGQVADWIGTCTEISDKRAERALEQETAFSTTLLASLPGMVYVLDRDGRLVRWNREYEIVVGKAGEDLLGTDALRPVLEEDKPRLASKMCTLFERGGFEQAEGRIRDATGQVRDYIFSGRRVELAGEPYLIGTGLDVTERKQAAEALQQATDFAERVIETANVIFLQLDGEGNVKRFNTAAREVTGYSAAEIEGANWFELLVPKDRYPQVWEEFKRIMSEGQTPRVFENAVLTKGGEERQILWKNSVLRDGNKIAGTISFGIDITERKRALEEQARLSRAVEQTTESIVITDSQGAILYVNPAFEAVTGYSRAEVIGKNPRILKSGYQDDAFYRRMWDTIAGGGVWKGRLMNRRKDGSLLEEDATIGPVLDASGALVNYVAVKRDVTNESMLGRQLLQAQKLESIGRLAGGVAHDFNNLLGVVMGYAEITRRRLSPADPLREKVDEILKAAERATNLTRQLLAFTRQQVLQPRVLDINALVSGTQKMLHRLIGEDIAINTALAPDAGHVRADPGQIEQVIMNLAVNGRDAMPEGGRLTIETRNADLDAAYASRHPPTPPGRYVMLAVSDTGSGMDAETQAHAFEPFFTTKEQGKGTGLGLSTVYGIVKQSEGFIWLYSEPGLGTTFKIYFPRVDADPTPSQHRETAPAAGGNETVLLVEDEASLRDLLSETLQTGGYSLLVAQHGAQAVQFAHEYVGVIHLIVTDVVMPGMTGRAAVECIAETRPETKVLYISGYAQAAVDTQGTLSPGAAFLSKPFTPDQLLRKVRELLDEY